MRFGSGPDAITCEVQYYRTNATESVGPTVYHSHIWDVDQKEWAAQIDEGHPGEIWGAARTGTANLLYQDQPGACDQTKGSQEAWLGEYKLGDPLYACAGIKIVDSGGARAGGSDDPIPVEDSGGARAGGEDEPGRFGEDSGGARAGGEDEPGRFGEDSGGARAGGEDELVEVLDSGGARAGGED
jgi:hypothetical protein